MEEIAKTHLPLLAWRWHEGRYELIHDDLPVGELSIDASGRGTARYHERRWILDPYENGVSCLREAATKKRLGSLHLQHREDPEEGRFDLEGKVFRFIRDKRKIPPRLSVTGAEGQPLLQFSEDDEERGRIQIDSQPAAKSPEFERLVLWGLHLYLIASPNLHTTPSAERQMMVRPQTMPAVVQTRLEKAEPWIRWTLGGGLTVYGMRQHGWRRWICVMLGSGIILTQKKNRPIEE
jgi:hypothetical protein